MIYNRRNTRIELIDIVCKNNASVALAVLWYFNVPKEIGNAVNAMGNNLIRYISTKYVYPLENFNLSMISYVFIKILRI